MPNNIDIEVLDILAKYAEIERGEIDEGTLLKDAGVDSLDMVEIIFDLEELFDLSIPNPGENENLNTEFNTAGDVVKAVEALLKEKRT